MVTALSKNCFVGRLTKFKWSATRVPTIDKQVGKQTVLQLKDPVTMMTKRAFNKKNWPAKLTRGWKKHARLGRNYIEVYVQILLSEFECIPKLVGNRMELVAPDHGTFPIYNHFARFIKKMMGNDAWHKAKRGVTRTLRTQVLPR